MLFAKLLRQKTKTQIFISQHFFTQKAVKQIVIPKLQSTDFF